MAPVNQNNTQVGPLPIIGTASLVGKENLLVKMTNASGTLNCVVPADIDDRVFGVVDDGKGAGEASSIVPLEPGRNLRVKLKGTCNPGDALVLADPSTPADAGKLRTVPAAADTYYILAFAEEVGVDGQKVKVRPAPREAVVVTA